MITQFYEVLVPLCVCIHLHLWFCLWMYRLRSNPGPHVERWFSSYTSILQFALSLSVCLSVGVRRQQFAIIARSSQEMYLTVRIVWQYILSRVRFSVRPSIFLYAKNNNKLPEKPTFAYLTVEWTSGRPVTMRSVTVTVEWPATLPCVDTTAVILIAGQIDQKQQNQPGETASIRVYTFTAWTMWLRNYDVAYAFVVCVCVQINNEELFLMLSFLQFHIILVLDRLRCGA